MIARRIVLTRPAEQAATFSRREAVRLGIAAIALVVVLTTILGVGLHPAAASG